VLVKDASTANHLFRIAQEAIANAVRHARAKHIEIHLSASKDQLLLGVADDGVGIRQARRPRKGIGLRIMNYRAELISGTLVVQKRAEGGTEVVCTVNLNLHKHAT
jgi:signal transduction histidine kinase